MDIWSAIKIRSQQEVMFHYHFTTWPISSIEAPQTSFLWLLKMKIAHYNLLVTSQVAHDFSVLPFNEDCRV